MKKLLFPILMLTIITGCTSTSISPEDTSSVSGDESNKILVSSSLIPISSMVNAIGGEYVEVNTLVPAGVSPHGFDLSARQMAEISQSQLVFMMGLESIDGFLEDAAPEEKQIHLADGITLLEAAEHNHKEEDEHSEEEHSHEDDEHGHSEEEHSEEEHSEEEEHMHEEDEHSEDEHGHDTDPHVWLGQENAVIIAQKIRDELTLILPEQATYFANNTTAFEAELAKIYSDFTEKTAPKTAQEFIVFHDAYNYLMQSVGIDASLKIPFSENVLHETATSYMAELIEEIELHGVKYVFREPQFSDGNLQSFASEYNLEVAVLDPIGTDDSASGYLDNLKNNLQSLELIYE